MRHSCKTLLFTFPPGTSGGRQVCFLSHRPESSSLFLFFSFSEHPHTHTQPKNCIHSWDKRNKSCQSQLWPSLSYRPSVHPDCSCSSVCTIGLNQVTATVNDNSVVQVKNRVETLKQRNKSGEGGGKKTVVQ